MRLNEICLCAIVEGKVLHGCEDESGKEDERDLWMAWLGNQLQEYVETRHVRERQF